MPSAAGRFSSPPIRPIDDTLLVRLVDEGDLPGALWKQGLFEGAHPR